ncbi:MAG: glycosyltransferase family 39 protein [Chloroflexota bacterium]|nr:glycosyltransferase family 39 protein [Chloroflexota bacterium]
MDRRFSSLMLLATALALAGLGHYYLLYQRIYIWDAVLFYVVAALLLALAWRAAGVGPDRSWAVVRSALQRLGLALRDLFLMETTRSLVTALAVANGLAALAAFLIPPPVGLLVALPLWGVGVAALVSLIRRLRPARPRPVPEVRDVPPPVIAGLEVVQPRRYALPLAATGWLLLLVGAVVLTFPDTLGPLRVVGDWLQPGLAELHVGVPLPPDVWPVGLLLSCVGVILIAWTRGGVDRLTGAPSLGEAVPVLRAVSRPSWPWLALALVGDLVWLGVVYSAVESSTSWAVVPLWLATLAAQAACWWRVDRARGVSALPARVERRTWLLLLALLVAFGLTLYRLGDVPNSMWGDEGAFWWWVRDLAKGVPANPFDLGVYGAFPVIGSLYQSIWVRLFGPTIWAWRLGSVVAGTLTLVPLFFLARKLLGDRVAWSAVALMIGMPYFLAYARIGFNSIQPLLPITLGLWLLIEALQRHSRLLAYLSGLACGMASLTYMSGHVGLLLVMLVWLFLFVSRRSLRRPLLSLALCLVLGWFFTAGPFLLGSVLGGRPLGWKVPESFIGNTMYGEAVFSPDELTRLYPLWQFGEQRVFFEPRLYALLFGRGMVRTWLSIVTGGIATQHYLTGPLAGPAPIFFLAGLAWVLGQCRRLPAVLWALWVLVCTLLLSVLNTFPPRPAHMATVIPALAVLSATGIWLLSDLLRRFVRPRWADWIGIVLTVVLVLCGLRAYFVVMPQEHVPNLENVMFWAAQEMERGSNLLFIVDEPYSPEFRVWGIDQFDLGVEYHSVPSDEVHRADFRALCGLSCRVFFLPERSDEILAQLQAQLGAGSVQTHVNREGQPIGLEFVPLVQEADVPAPE